MGKMAEPELRTADHKGLKDFAGDVMVRMRELDNMESSNMLLPDQANEILASMMENYIYSVIQVIMKKERAEMDRREGLEFVEAFTKQLENFPKKEYTKLYLMILEAARRAAGL